MFDRIMTESTCYKRFDLCQISSPLRPKWLYKSWMKHGHVKSDHNSTRHEVKLCNNENSTNGLQLLLDRLDEMIVVFNSSGTTALDDELNDILHASVDNLQKHYELFRKCRLLKTGSVVEGTKLNEAGDYDFLLILDFLKETDNVHVYFTEASEIQMLVDECSNTEKILRESPELFSRYPGSIRESHAYFSNFKNVKHRSKDRLECETEIKRDEDYKDTKETSTQNVESNVNSAEKFKQYIKEDSEIKDGGFKQSIGDKLKPETTNITDKQYIDNAALQSTDITECSSYQADAKKHSGIEESIVSENDVIVIKNIPEYCMTIFLEAFQKILKDSTHFWLDETDGICASDFAVTLHLFSEKYKCTVDIDVCFCIPITRQDLETNVKSYNDNHFICNLMDRNIGLEVFAILGSKSPLLGADVTIIRVTAPEIELSYFRHYGKESDQVKVYRYAKCLLNLLYPKVTSSYGCQRCLLYVVKSYHLKNIILFMINNYKENELWSDMNLATRILEVFEILNECGKTGFVSTYCKPGSISISEFVTFTNLLVSFDFKGKRGSDVVYVKDSEIRYKVAYCPKYDVAMETSNEDVNNLIKQYFDHLNQEHWNSFDIIEKVKTLINNIYDIKCHENEALCLPNSSSHVPTV